MIVLGIDTSSRLLECKWSGSGETFRCENNARGHLRLVKHCRKIKVGFVVIEATGGYERAACRMLWAAGISVSVINPRWVRDFAKSVGRYAKNDRQDADILVLYGERMSPSPTTPLEKEAELLKQLLTRREQLLDMVVMEKNHEKAPEVPASVRKSIRTHRIILQKQIQQLDKSITELIQSSETMRPKAEKLQKQVGVGPVLMAVLIADMPELGTVRRNVASALVGVAPYDDDSGNRSGNRKIAGGRRRPRRALYMATLAAIRHEKYLNEFYKRLRGRGKPHKVAAVACMRKLIIRLNTVLKENSEQPLTAGSH